jgi:hypothetical protein
MENTNSLASRSAETSIDESNMLSSDKPKSFEFAPLVALWSENPPPQPRVGGALLGENHPQSLMAVAQTHTVSSSSVDIQPYKLNDELIHTSLYSHPRDTSTMSKLLNLKKRPFLAS